jgi:hypothetical protein
MSFCGFHTWNINTAHFFLSFTSQNTIRLFTSCDWCPLLPYDTFKNLFLLRVILVRFTYAILKKLKWTQRGGSTWLLVSNRNSLVSRIFSWITRRPSRFIIYGPVLIHTGIYICIYTFFYGSVFTPAQHRYYLRNCYTAINNRTFKGRAVSEIGMATRVTKRSIT